MISRRLELNVQLLLYAIQKTTTFESLLGRRFSGVTLDSSISHQIAKKDVGILDPYEIVPFGYL